MLLLFPGVGSLGLRSIYDGFVWAQARLSSQVQLFYFPLLRIKGWSLEFWCIHFRVMVGQNRLRSIFGQSVQATFVCFFCDDWADPAPEARLAS